IPHPDNGLSQTSCAGILVTTVADCARHLDVTSGPHPGDRTSLPKPTASYEELIDTLDLSGITIGWSLDLGFATVDPEVAAIAEDAARALTKAVGATWTPVDVHLTDPVRVWLGAGALDLFTSLEPGMWPACADELEGLPRVGIESSINLTPPQLARIVQRRMRLEQEVG